MSKLNPQKATAYVGPGVLRKGGKITPVPNGPLVKKKGPFKGSTLKTGGRVIKKAQEGTTLDKIKEQNRLRQNLTDFRKKVGSTPLTPQLRREKDSLTGLLKNFSTNQRVQATGLTPAQLAANDAQAQKEAARKPDVVDESCQKRGLPTSGGGCSGSARKNAKRLKKERNRKNGGTIAKAKSGAMIKRADGSYSKRGLWDSIRENKGSGKKPTKQMLVQEKKIKAKSKK
jgi:hypothetical protein